MMASSVVRLLGPLAVSLALHAALFAVVGDRPPEADDWRQTLAASPRAATLDVWLGKSAEPEKPMETPTVNREPPVGMGELPAPEPVPEALTALPTVAVPAVEKLEYLPARELDGRPYPVSPIVVPFPDVPLGKHKGRAVLVLFIASDGAIDRAEVEESDLPAQLEKVAVDTFLNARMNPGMKNGQAVPSRLKVEVGFEE
ncbi:MAG TPA: energy transducer TonB [Rhodocyclaceae bacterium]|nr:energy transducer TonB [Rhodocyclaceae bacterium]